MITQSIRTFKFQSITTPLNNYHYNESGLVLKLLLNKTGKDNRIIAQIPGCVKISLRFGKKEDVNKNFRDKSECLFQITDENGCAPILDVELYFYSDEHPQWQAQKLSIPLKLYNICEKELWIVCNKTHFRLAYDGYVINEDLTYGVLNRPSGEKIFVDDEYIKRVECSNDLECIEFGVGKNVLQSKMICYTPFGHNTFIGDVVNFFHDGTYHMLYMPDTHHHANRWFCGAHHFEHMITKDFINWEDAGPVWDITKQWESTGTGTMFFWKGKYYVAFGLHTNRMKADDRLITDEIHDYFDKHHETQILSYDEIFKSGKFPIGASYAVSDDGINFKCSNKIISFVDNPSVYVKDGRLIMFSGGNIWGSDDIDKSWKVIRKDFPPCYQKSGMLNTEECPSYFEWNGYQYLIMGFTGFWKTEKNGDEFFDGAANGYDIYDGLSVPMAVKTDNNRVIMAGWIGGIGWGSAVVHRELVEFEDGNLGSRWLPELIPETKLIKSISESEIDYLSPNPKGEYYIEARIKSGCGGRYGLKFLYGEENGCELQLDFDRKQAQFSEISSKDELSDNIKPLHRVIDKIKEEKDCKFGNNVGYSYLHCHGRDFSIANIRYTDETILKIMAYYHPKMDTTVIDVEINGERTMISNRTDFLINRIKSCCEGNVQTKEFKIYSAEIL